MTRRWLEVLARLWSVVSTRIGEARIGKPEKPRWEHSDARARFWAELREGQREANEHSRTRP